MRKFKFVFFLALSLLSPALLWSAQEAQIQLAIATPDPIKAGEEITFQVIFINTSAAKWEGGSYSAVIEIFDSESKYIRKVNPVAGIQDIKSGESSLHLISEAIPDDYWGQYLFRVSLILKGKTILLSDFYPFQVKATVRKEKIKERKWAFSGNAIFSNKIELQNFKSTSSADTSKYLGNFSINSLGNLPFGTMVFNMSAYRTEDEILDLYSIYGSISGRKSFLEVGDVMPFFSDLSLSGQTGRGAHFNFYPDKYNLSLVTIKTIDAEEGTLDTNGTYARYILGINGKTTIVKSLNLGLSAISSFDDSNSISFPGTDNSAIKSNLISYLLNWNIGDLTLNGEIGISNNSDNYDVNSSTTANAFMTSVSYKKDFLKLDGEYYKYEPEFISMGSPRIINDRLGYGGRLSLRPVSWGTINYSYKSFNDNVDNLPASQMITTHQQINNGGISFYIQNWPSFSVSMNNNAVWSDPAGSLDNKTLTTGASISYSFKNQFVTIGSYISDFKDLTDTSPDLKTYSINVNYSGSISSMFNLSFGVSQNKVENLLDNSNNKTDSASIGLTMRLIPDKISLILYNSLINRRDNSISTPFDNSDMRSSLELTYRINSGFSLTGGGSLADYKDNIEGVNDYKSYSFLLRGLYNF